MILQDLRERLLSRATDNIEEINKRVDKAAYELTRMEGIVPAIESAHAVAALSKLSFRPDDVVVLTVSGRGDKDIETYLANPQEDKN